MTVSRSCPHSDKMELPAAELTDEQIELAIMIDISDERRDMADFYIDRLTARFNSNGRQKLIGSFRPLPRRTTLPGMRLRSLMWS